MSNQMSDSDSHQHNNSWLFSRTGIATIGALAVLGFLVYTGHSAHLLGFLPYLFILACPLMHVFMHGGHHNHHSADNGGKAESHSHDDHHDHHSVDDSEKAASHSHGGGGCCGGDDDDNKQDDKKPLSSPTSTRE